MIQITISDDSPVNAFFQKLVIEGAAKRTLLDQLGAYFVGSTRARMDSEITPQGEPWKKSIRASKTSGKTLHDTGSLYNSITHFVIGDDAVEFGTTLDYGIPLHYGATIFPVAGKYLSFKIPGLGWVKTEKVSLPAREWLGVSAQDELHVIDVISGFLKREVA